MACPEYGLNMLYGYPVSYTLRHVKQLPALVRCRLSSKAAHMDRPGCAHSVSGAHRARCAVWWGSHRGIHGHRSPRRSARLLDDTRGAAHDELVEGFGQVRNLSKNGMRLLVC